MPKSWTAGPQRCAKAGVPEPNRKFKTKDELAVEMVQCALTKVIKFGWVRAEAGYGNGLSFCKAMAMLFMLTEKINHAYTCPLMICADIEESLTHFPPRRDTPEEEVVPN